MYIYTWLYSLYPEWNHKCGCGCALFSSLGLLLNATNLIIRWGGKNVSTLNRRNICVEDLQGERLRKGADGRTCEAEALTGDRSTHSAVFGFNHSFIYFWEET